MKQVFKKLIHCDFNAFQTVGQNLTLGGGGVAGILLIVKTGTPHMTALNHFYFQ